MKYTTQKQIREAFWETNEDLDLHARRTGVRSKRQNAQCAAVRQEFVEFVDYLQRNGMISTELADRVTL